MEKHRLPDIPPLPHSFVDWIIAGNIIVFVGAGVSALCGYPLWNKLADNLVSDFRSSGSFNFQFEDSIKRGNYTPIQKITILSQHLQNGEKMVADKICDIFKYENCDMEKARKVANYLYAFNSSIITTNADLVLDKNDENSKYIKYNSAKEISKSGLDRRSILHLHGSIEAEESLIFTEKQYAINYLPTEKVGEILSKTIKGDKAILFIGYSLSEFELLKYFIDPNASKGKNKLFKLDAYYHSEENTRLILDKEYYEALGIELIPYFIDEKGYDVLLDVLQDWVSKIESQISPSGILYLDIADAISKKPTKARKQLVFSNFDKIDHAFFHDKIVSSSYYKEWIKEFWKNTCLFDPNPYLLDDSKSEKKARSFWAGLLILRHYIRKQSIDKSIEAKINAMMKKTASLVKKKDSSLGTYKGIDSISIILSEILFSRVELMNNKSIFDTLVKLYISNNQYGAYTLVCDLFEKEDYFVGKITSSRLFEILTFIVNNGKDEREQYTILGSNKNQRIIMTEPLLYYKEALRQLKKADWSFSVIGSFLHFASEENSFLYKQKMYASWLLTAVPFIDKEQVEKDIKMLLKTKSRYLNKIGICLLGLRLKELLQLFFDNIDLFFNTYQYTADMILLIENNINIIRENDNLKKNIKERLGRADFGSKDPVHIETIRKTISNILSKIDNNFESYNLTSAEEEIIFHLDSSASFFNVDTSKEIDAVYSIIKDKTIDEMVLLINNLNKGESFFFDASIIKAIDKYLKDKEFSTYKDKLRQIGFDYLVSYICNSDFVQTSNDGVERFVFLYKNFTADEKMKTIKSILYVCQRFAENETVDIPHKTQLIKSINYRFVTIESSNDTAIRIGTVLNSELHLYWSVLYEFSKYDETGAKKLLLESYKYFYGQYHHAIPFKAVVSSWFSLIYYYSSDLEKSSLFEYVFTKEKAEISFRIFSYSSNVDWFLEKLCELNSFQDYIFDNKSDEQERIALASRIVLRYLFSNELESMFKTIIFNNDVEVIEHSFLVLEKNADKFTRGEFKNRLDVFLDGCIDCFRKIEKRKSSYNQIFNYLIEMMNSTKKERNPKMWECLGLLSRGLSYQSNRPIIELINAFTEKESKEYERFFETFFECYNSTYIFDGSIIEIFIKLKTISCFKNKLKHWATLISSNNPSIYPKLSQIIVDGD